MQYLGGYHYFIDSAINHHRFARELARIETRLTDLGIKGRMARLTPIHDLSFCIKEALGEGAHTLITIGNDHALSRLVSFLYLHPHLTIGMVPVGAGPFRFARSLGIPEGLPACDTLAARRTEALDMGGINATELFLSAAEVEHLPCILECDHRFQIRESPSLHATIQNLISFRYHFSDDSPTDGRFTVRLGVSSAHQRFFKKGTSPHTSLPARAVKILPLNSDVTVTIDGFRLVHAPLTLDLLPRHLFFIVGKERKF